jgi:hypothetical protein
LQQPELHFDAAHPDEVTVAEDVLDHALSVDDRAIGRAHVDEPKRSAETTHLGVKATDADIIENEITVEQATDVNTG